MKAIDLFFCLLHYAMWNNSEDISLERLSHKQYVELMQLGRKQTVMGLIAQSLIDNNIQLESNDVFDTISIINTVGLTNKKLDEATTKICKMMDEQNIRILVVKGQTLAPLYPQPALRQCGDVDFLCHPDDIGKAVRYLRDELDLKLNDEGSNKHAGFWMDGVKYEIHRTLTNFAYPAHQRYWEDVIMKEVWQNPYVVTVNDIQVPTLAPTYNALFVFVHIMFHLIVDGIGLRQFCDWAMILDKDGIHIDRQLLHKHLEGIGLLKAYSCLGAVLTDYLGLPMEKFPMEISTDKHRRACSLMDNVIKMGNFGHNVAYKSAKGPKHAIEHLVRMWKQCRRFYKYAPKEILWRIPYFFGWWSKRIFRKMTPFIESSKTIFQK